MTTGPTFKPPPHPFYGDNWHRGLDPWHRDSFPAELADRAPNQSPERGSGWYLEDAFGNEIGYVADGTEYAA